MTHHALTADRTLCLAAGDDALPHLAAWLPFSATAVHAAPADADVIAVERGPRLDLPELAREATDRASIGDVRCEVHGRTGWVAAKGLSARVDLEQGRALVRIEDDTPSFEILAVMNFTVSLLLTQRRRYLTHAAAVADPDGDAWLLAGDSHAGKTTTAVNLARAGWQLLSDDHVVLEHRPDGGWTVEGWPRRMHLDEGWPHNPVGRRGLLSPDDAGVTLAAPATLAGIFLPRVVPGATDTSVDVARQSDALSMVLRQTAWSMLDPAHAARTLRDIQDISGRPRFHLRLGLDTFGDPARLARIVSAHDAVTPAH